MKGAVASPARTGDVAAGLNNFAKEDRCGGWADAQHEGAVAGGLGGDGVVPEV